MVDGESRSARSFDAMALLAEVVRRQARPLAPALLSQSRGQVLRSSESQSAHTASSNVKQQWASNGAQSSRSSVNSMHCREIPEHAFVASQPVEWLHCRHSQPELTGSNSPDRFLWPCHNVSLHLLHHPSSWRARCLSVAALSKTAQTCPVHPRRCPVHSVVTQYQRMTC